MRTGSEKPKRPRSHEVGEIAVNSFKHHCPESWAINDSRNDYGWDLFVTLSEDHEVTAEDFFVQIKGSDNPNYIESGAQIGFSLETGTIEWLLGRPMPSMLAICDTGKDNRPVYWVWIRHAVGECLKSNPKGLEQKTLTLHVPVSNLLQPSTAKVIEEDVKRFHSERIVLERMGQAFHSALGTRAQTEDLLSYRGNPGSFLFKHAEPLVDAGILSLPDNQAEETVSVLSVEDQKRFRTLKAIQTALQELRERDAGEALSKIAEEIEQQASDYIKAFFYNVLGQFHQYTGQLPRAVEDYFRAKEYSPGDVALEAGLLHAQFALAWCSENFKASLPEDWINRVENVLLPRPQDCRLLRLKAAYICDTHGPTTAEEFLRSSVAWDLEPRQSMCYLAYLYSHSGDIDSAEKILGEAEGRGLELDAIDWSVYGFVWLRKAFREVGPLKDTPIFGPGPAKMDFKALRRAQDCYDRAYNYFRRRGFPKVSGETVINYSIVLRLLGHNEQAVELCRPYLKDNPDDAHAHGALAGCLLAMDQAADAAPHARAAFELEPQASLAFNNLALCLYQAEEFDDLLRLLHDRQETGFLDRSEEELCRFLAVTAYAEQGYYTEAKTLIQETKNASEFGRSVPIMEAVLAEKTSIDKGRVIEIFRQARHDFPADVLILTHFVAVLFPLSVDTAPDMISCLEEVRTLRQLASHEYRLLAQAYVCMNHPEAADDILVEGSSIFPDDSRLIAERVNVQVELGDEETAYELLVQVRGSSISDYSISSNLALLAARTGRLDKAIEFFERSLAKTHDNREKRIIHNQLYQLRLKRGDDPETILRHVVNFGNTTSTDEEEVTYLVMFLMSPHVTEPSDEVNLWIQEFQRRMAEFTERHPDFPSFKSFKIPDEIPEEDRGFWIASEIAAVMLPHELGTAKLWQSARERPWPLVFRASYCPGESVFDYWSRCSRSETFSHAIHIFGAGNDLAKEVDAATQGDSVCIDVTALITLAALDLLDLLAECFRLIFIGEGTRHSILMESAIPSDQHPLAVKIGEWIEANRTRIRTRKGCLGDHRSADTPPYEKTPGGIWMQQRGATLDIGFPYGAGESLLLAKKLGVPLYSDESTLRAWARNDYGVAVFSTVAFTSAFVKRNLWTYDNETDVFARLIGMNYRWVPFGIMHLNSRLEAIIAASNKVGVQMSSAALLQDESMLRLMRWFGEPRFPDDKRIAFAINWWRSIIGAHSHWREILVACMTYPTDCYVSGSVSSVLRSKIMKNEREIKAAQIFSAFLWTAYKKHKKDLGEVWLAIKDCVHDLFPHTEEGDQLQELILLDLIPKSLYSWANQDRSVDENKRTIFLVDISSQLPHEAKEPFERTLAQLFVRKLSRHAG